MIELQYFGRSDFTQLIEWIESPQFLLQWAGSSFNYPLTISQLEEYIKGANRENSELYVYKVVDTETGRTVGHISLGRIDRSNQSARVGRVLVGDNEMRGKKIGQQMLQSILQFAFQELKLHRVSLGVFDFNKSAIACYEKVGFVKEGLLRDYIKHGEEYWNMWEMSILEKEWQKGSGAR